MKITKQRKKYVPTYKDYPKTDAVRSGCKVGWRIYTDRHDAEVCAEAARWNAVIQESHGYDFGYCMPGSITVLEDGRFEVCIP